MRRGDPGPDREPDDAQALCRDGPETGAVLGVLRRQHPQSEYPPGVCDGGLSLVQPLYVAGYIEKMIQNYAAATIKQNLAGLRQLFDPSKRFNTGRVVIIGTRLKTTDKPRSSSHILLRNKNSTFHNPASSALSDHAFGSPF